MSEGRNMEAYNHIIARPSVESYFCLYVCMH